MTIQFKPKAETEKYYETTAKGYRDNIQSCSLFSENWLKTFQHLDMELAKQGEQ